MAFLGADTGQMQVLVARLSAGAVSYRGLSDEIMRKLDVAAEELCVAIAGLSVEAGEIAAESEATGRALFQESQGTVWNGKNRDTHDTALNELLKTSSDITAGMVRFVGDAKGLVDGSIKASLADSHRKVGEFSVSIVEFASSASAYVQATDRANQEILGNA
jgi:hypothetical protein